MFVAVVCMLLSMVAERQGEGGTRTRPAAPAITACLTCSFHVLISIATRRSGLLFWCSEVHNCAAVLSNPPGTFLAMIKMSRNEPIDDKHH